MFALKVTKMCICTFTHQCSPAFSSFNHFILTGFRNGVYRVSIRILLYGGGFKFFTWWPWSLLTPLIQHGVFIQSCLNHLTGYHSISYKSPHSCIYIVLVPKVEDFFLHGNVFINIIYCLLNTWKIRACNNKVKKLKSNQIFVLLQILIFIPVWTLGEIVALCYTSYILRMVFFTYHS